MKEQDELKQIKSLYGEKFMHLCRMLFPTLLEKNGVLLQILTTHFATNSRSLGDDITENLEEDFKYYIYSKINAEKEQEKKEQEKTSCKTPYELLDEAGYKLYECTTEEEIQKFKKYYQPDEEICTFYGGRLARCVVFWAVKKDVNKIKRENFINPKREDEYGTSVMSIQFSKGEYSTVSIKNRYNHKVNNPDATYGNDLDRIIPGLTRSFTNLLANRGMKLSTMNVETLEIPRYTVAIDGKYYKYNMEINGIYYCSGNIIIDKGQVIKLEPERYVLMDYFILDKKVKNITLYDSHIRDCFGFFFHDEDKIEKIDMKKSTEDKEMGTRIIIIKTKEGETSLEIDKDNNIISYRDEQIKEIGNYFLKYNHGLYKLELPKLEKVGSEFLRENQAIRELSLPSLTLAGQYFLSFNTKINQIDLKKLQEVGEGFLKYNKALESLNLPSLKKVGNYFISNNEILSQVELPNLQYVGNSFLYANICLKYIKLPNLIKVGHCFLYSNEILCSLDLPKLQDLDIKFLYNNKGLNIKFDKIKKVGALMTFEQYYEELPKYKQNVLAILKQKKIIQDNSDVIEK